MSYERAVRLREAGDAPGILDLVREHPDDPRIAYQCAWTHDKAGLEREAVPFYEAALALGLQGEERLGAYLGLGSTYRCLGRYEDSLRLLETALGEFPASRALQVFRALTLYNLKRFEECVGELIRQLAETSSDPGVQGYARALAYYSDKLEETW